jgi:hypothetical protein
MTEIWKRINNLRYEISTLGRIRSLKYNLDRPRLIKSRPDGRGYYQIILFDNYSVRKTYNVARLVLETFVGPCPVGMEASHLDGMKDNNSLENLIWESHKDNMLRYEKHKNRLNDV